jgi:hypothetical protein
LKGRWVGGTWYVGGNLLNSAKHFPHSTANQGVQMKSQNCDTFQEIDTKFRRWWLIFPAV